MIKLVVQIANDGEFQTLCTREYDEASFVVPEPRHVLTIPDDGEDEEQRYYVENVIHDLAEEQPELRLIVKDEEEVIRQVRQQRAQMQQMKKLQQAAQQGGQGGNPFGGGGGNGGGNNSPFSL